MSLSPQDDPRTWLVPGPRAVPRPPLHARLLYYDLTTAERALLRSMFEHAPEGATMEASPETYAETSGLSVRHIRNLIYGWNRKDGHRVRGLVERHILAETRKGRRAPNPKPAAYVFNEWALHLRPELASRLEVGIQLNLPGVRRPGESTEAESPSAMVADRHRKSFPQPSAMVADDSKTTNSTTRQGGIQQQPPPHLDGDQVVCSMADALAAEICVPRTSANLKSMAAAITAESHYVGVSPEQAAAAIADHVRRDRDQGIAIDRFYFEDTKWRSDGRKTKASPSALRTANIKANVAEGIRRAHGLRDSADSREREDRAPPRLGK